MSTNSEQSLEKRLKFYSKTGPIFVDDHKNFLQELNINLGRIKKSLAEKLIMGMMLENQISAKGTYFTDGMIKAKITRLLKETPKEFIDNHLIVNEENRPKVLPYLEIIRELFISNIENIDSIEEALIICLEKKYETGEKVHSQDSTPTGVNPEMFEDIRNYIKTGELGNIVLLEKRDLEEILHITN